MKRKITNKLVCYVMVIMVVILGINYLLQLEDSVTNFEYEANSTLNQIAIILEDNEVELELLTESLKSNYIVRAQAVAHIVELVGEQTPEEYQEMAQVLEVDEIHLFDETGYLYAGSVPIYFGYDFNSGEQMHFFASMLEDKSLSLCQDVTPNTAEGKSMIYAAVWRNDKQGIVQIGLEPSRLLEAQENNEISKVFGEIRVNEGDTIFAIDRESGVILGSSIEDFVGENSENIGIEISEDNMQANSFYATINGVESICSFERKDTIYIGVVQSKQIIIDEIQSNMYLILIYICLIGVIFIGAVIFLIDKMFLKDFRKILNKLEGIYNGNLDVVISEDSTDEFRQLSKNLNFMLKSMLNKTTKLSEVLERSGMEVGLYEYKEDMSRVLGTHKLKDLLKIDITETKRILADKQLFERKIRQIKNNVEDKEKHIYRVANEIESYVKIETFKDKQGEHGVIIDVTEEVLEKKKLKYQRDHDDLTNFLNRRGFYKWMNVLEEENEALKHAVIIIFDVDNLKTINDNFGYHKGDLAILKTVDVLNEIQVANKLIARLGGDDFAVILYGFEEQEQIKVFLEEIKSNIKNLTIDILGKDYAMTLSIGYAYYKKGDKYNEILKLADKALLEAKSNGKAQMLEYSK